MGQISEEKTERNAEIYRRRVAGETPTVLGKAYDLSPNRIYRIVCAQKKKQDARYGDAG